MAELRLFLADDQVDHTLWWKRLNAVGPHVQALVDRHSQFGSACHANDANGRVANARNSFGYCCALRLALHAIAAAFTPESTVTAH